MDLSSIEEFFKCKIECEEGMEPGSLDCCCWFEKGGMKYQLLAMRSESRLYINADPHNAKSSTPAVEVSVQYDNTEFEDIENIGLGLKFFWKGKEQKLYLTRLENGYSISAW